MSVQEENSVECPVCYKEFSANVIETHVTKCLFLNESTNNSQESSKRYFNSQGGSPVLKRPKHNTENVNRSFNSSDSQADNQHLVKIFFLIFQVQCRFLKASIFLKFYFTDSRYTYKCQRFCTSCRKNET